MPNLITADLSSANLANADINGADFITADLSSANLVNADMTGAESHRRRPHRRRPLQHRLAGRQPHRCQPHGCRVRWVEGHPDLAPVGVDLGQRRPGASKLTASERAGRAAVVELHGVPVPSQAEATALNPLGASGRGDVLAKSRQAAGPKVAPDHWLAMTIRAQARPWQGPPASIGPPPGLTSAPPSRTFVADWSLRFWRPLAAKANPPHRHFSIWPISRF